MLKEFREFIARGNVLDLAVAVIIGGAFGKIVASLVDDILMPVLGVLLGGIAFSEQVVQIGEALIKWGAFLQAVIDFLIIALVIFLITKLATLRKKQPEAPAEPTEKDCPYCFTRIPLQATRCPHCTSQLK